MLGLAAAQLAPTPPAAAQDFEPSEPALWALSGGAFLVAWHLDAQLRRDDASLQDGVPAGLATLGYVLGGREFLGPAIISTTALAHFTDWPTEGSRAVRVTAGAVMAGVAVEVLKNAVGRGRPRDSDHPRRFQPFTRENAWLSFPSGHAAAGFAVAGALDQEFDLRGLDPLLYGLAGLIAWSRIYDDAHWASDTVAGGIIGLATARGTVSWLQSRSDAALPRLNLAVASDGAPMLSVSVPVR